MNSFAKTFSLSACALAASVLISACGGGSATDTVAPTATVTSAASTTAGAAAGTKTFTFVFSESVGSSFSVEDLVVTDGTPSNFTKVSATNYTVDVTPTGSATPTVTLPAGKVFDSANNPNTVAFTLGAPTATDTVLASFDEATALAYVGFNGGEGSAVAAGPSGGSGNAAKVLRTGGDPWAGAKVAVSAINLTTTNRTISARVYSPTAGTPMVLKLEGPNNISTGDMPAVETVVAGWQTLTWVVPTAAISTAYNSIVMLPNLGTVASVTPGETYYFDDFKLVGGGTATTAPTGGTPNPSAVAGSAGPVSIPTLTAPYLNGFGVVGDAVFAGDYVGSVQSNGNKAGWPSATTFGVASNGNIGYFQDGLLSGPSQSTQKLEENGWVAGLTSLAPPPGVPSFFRFFILQGPSSTFASSYMGLFANAPNNGTVDVSSYGSIKFKAWGPAQMYQEANFAPTLEMKLTGPKIEGCTATGSGATEIRKTFVADQKIGAGSDYKLSLAGWTVVGVCGTDTTGTAVASVLSKLAQVVLTVPGSSFNFTNLNSDGITYTTGVNLGPIIFTAN